MAITILRHGNKEATKKNFQCPVCWCQFTADYVDYFAKGGRYFCNCPECTMLAPDMIGEPDIYNIPNIKGE